MSAAPVPEASWSDALVWPEERAGDAVAALATAAGLDPRVVEIPRLAGAETLEAAVERFAAWLGVDAEPVSAAFVDVEPLLASAAPALVRVGREGVLALARTGPRSATFVRPEGGTAKVPLERLREALTPAAALGGLPEVDRMLDRAGVAGARRARARSELLRRRFSQARVEGVWILRRAVTSSFIGQLRRAGVLSDVAALAALHAAQMALYTASWWVLGASALAGHLDGGWLVGWALLLVTIVPLRQKAALVEGRIAVESGVLLKRRLLAGAFLLDPDAMRADGAGRMMSRVLESEAVEHLALDAGGALLFAAIEIALAAVVLGAGARAGAEVALLSVFTAFGVAVSTAMFRRRGEWTDARLSLTHDMIERLVGHRTRVAQEPVGEWHEGEDRGVRRAFDASKRMDACVVTLAAFLPRAWLVASVAVLAHAVVTGPREPAGVAVTVGGALLAYRAFRRVAQGGAAVAGVAVAWRRVAPLFTAAAQRPSPPSPRVVVSRAEERAGDEVLVDARDVGFTYAGRRDPVVEHVFLTVKREEHVLLLGPSGAGKSTLGSLLSGLRTPSSGLLLLDGLDASTLGIAAWRRRVTSAPQFHENHVLAATFAFNLLMGRSWPPSDEDLALAEEICRELGLGELLDRMPAGLMQTVGDTGWQLSHGEKSRMFLARALLQDADLVVLDESFAALDPGTLARAVACARQRARALVVIAHP